MRSHSMYPKVGYFDICTPSTPYGVLNGVLNWKYSRKSSPLKFARVIHLKVNLGQLMKISFLLGLSGGRGNFHTFFCFFHYQSKALVISFPKIYNMSTF